MSNSRLFQREINLIQSVELQDFVKYYLDNCVGAWFWKSGASSSGKYHPCFSQGEGGLVRHTKAVVLFCEELMRMSTYAYMRDEYKDYAIVACILHDTCKYGTKDEEDTSLYADHAKNASENIKVAWREFFGENAPELLCLAVASHMGQWTTDKEDRPFTPLDRLVHLADYIASRSFIDIPSITREYNEDADEQTALVEELIASLPFC